MESGVGTMFTLNLPYFGELPIPNVVVMCWIAMAVLIIWALLATRKMKEVPGKLQNTAEVVVEAVNNFAKSNMGHDGRKFAAYIGSLGLFLAISNTVGALFFSAPTGGLIAPPTRSFAVPVALALMTIVIAVGAGIWKRGPIGFIKKLFKPLPFLLPFNLIEYAIKPLSLSMRLFGNIFGAYILMEMIYHNLPWFCPAIACLYFDLFDGGLQAFVFVLLTALYIGEEIEVEE